MVRTYVLAEAEKKIIKLEKEVKELEEQNDDLNMECRARDMDNAKLQYENDELEGTNRMWKDEIGRLKKEKKKYYKLGQTGH